MKNIKCKICQLAATHEWLCLDSISYIAECLEACTSIDMLADLREIFPRQALTVASVQVCELQRKRIQKWLQVLNGESHNLETSPQASLMNKDA